MAQPVPPSRDSALFAQRSERKFFLDPAHAEDFLGEVQERLAAHRFRGPNTHVVPQAVHYNTTVYFDSPSRLVALACARGGANIKLRARAYHDTEPLRTPTPARESLIWLEVKSQSGTNTRKARFGLPAAEVSHFVATGRLEGLRVASEDLASAQYVAEEVRELHEHLGEPLGPNCLAHYRRRAWQNVAGTLRITLDTRLAFHAAPLGIFNSPAGLRNAVATPPCGQIEAHLIELKTRGPVPSWFDSLVGSAQLEPAVVLGRPFSKFLAASRTIHGPIAQVDGPRG